MKFECTLDGANWTSWVSTFLPVAALLLPSPLKAIITWKKENKLKMETQSTPVAAPTTSIADVIEVKDFLAAVVKAGITAKNNDGVIDLKDIMLLGPIMMMLPSTIQAAEKAVGEIKFIPDHITELAGSIAADLGLDPNGDAGFYVGEGVKVLESVYNIVKHVTAPKAA